MGYIRKMLSVTPSRYHHKQLCLFDYYTPAHLIDPHRPGIILAKQYEEVWQD